MRGVKEWLRLFELRENRGSPIWPEDGMKKSIANEWLARWKWLWEGKTTLRTKDPLPSRAISRPRPRPVSLWELLVLLRRKDGTEGRDFKKRDGCFGRLDVKTLNIENSCCQWTHFFLASTYVTVYNRTEDVKRKKKARWEWAISYGLVKGPSRIFLLRAAPRKWGKEMKYV
ncbi:hypothetical protein R1flu_024127 [Riccia fluitans]|uniref:Uncharacterized protein n=1 Tax=Riccia fluitans TaxID=41844 RepID=A0ABD1XU13_9MARC